MVCQVSRILKLIMAHCRPLLVDIFQGIGLSLPDPANFGTEHQQVRFPRTSTTRLQNVQVSLALGLCVMDYFCRQMNRDRMIFGDSAVNSKPISYKFCKA